MDSGSWIGFRISSSSVDTDTMDRTSSRNTSTSASTCSNLRLGTRECKSVSSFSASSNSSGSGKLPLATPSMLLSRVAGNVSSADRTSEAKDLMLRQASKDLFMPFRHHDEIIPGGRQSGEMFAQLRMVLGLARKGVYLCSAVLQAVASRLPFGCAFASRSYGSETYRPCLHGDMPYLACRTKGCCPASPPLQAVRQRWLRYRRRNAPRGCLSPPGVRRIPFVRVRVRCARPSFAKTGPRKCARCSGAACQ